MLIKSTFETKICTAQDLHNWEVVNQALTQSLSSESKEELLRLRGSVAGCGICETCSNTGAVGPAAPHLTTLLAFARKQGGS